MKYIMLDGEQFQGYSLDSFIHNPTDWFTRALCEHKRESI